MRRKEKQITDSNELKTIIRNSDTCRLAMSYRDRPYVVPLSFGYDNNTLYFHSAKEGKKIDILKNNPHICFEFDIKHHLVKGDNACNWGMEYSSIIGFGEVEFIEDIDKKTKALNNIMNQYSNKKWEYETSMLNKTTVFKVNITEMVGKKSGQ